MRMLEKGRMLMTLAAAIFCAPAMAVEYSCVGPVSGVTVSLAGVVSAESAGGQNWGYFCQIGATTNNASSDACKAVLSLLLTAQATGKSVRLWYNDSNTCSTYRGWQWLNTVYWGPKLED